MPRPTKYQKGPQSPAVIPIAEVTEPRCHVCQSKYRRSIDRMIALGTSYAEIARQFGEEVDRRSISTHAQKHLNYEEAAVREIIEEETRQAGENSELGVRGMRKRRVYLQTVVEKGMQALLDGNVTAEIKDTIGAIQELEKIDRHGQSAQVEQVERQFTAYMKAMSELCTEEQMAKIVERSREIFDNVVEGSVVEEQGQLEE